MNRRENILNCPALIPVAGNYDRKPRSLDRDVTSIGRARGSDLCLEANEISTLHCVIYRTVEGYRVRDCNSRTGTRVNGDAVKNHILRDGDIVNMGPFSFELRIPPSLFPKEGQKFDSVKVVHWKESRRRLGLHALKYRARLKKSGNGSSAREEELAQKAHLLKEKIRSYDLRSGELEAAERELAEDREKLDAEKETHEKHVQKIENSTAKRLTEVEEEIRQRWQEFQQRCREELPIAKQAQTESATGSSAEEEILLRLHREAEEQQQRLLALDEQLKQQKEQLAHERQEFATMKEQWVKDQSQSSTSVEQQKAAFAQQEAALKTQKNDLMRMMGDLKKMQEDLRKQSKGDMRALHLENEQLQKEIAQLQAQRQESQALLDENQQLRELVQELEQKAGQSAGPSAEDETSRQIEIMRLELEIMQEELQKKEKELEESQKDGPAIPANFAAIEKEIQQLHGENDLLKKLLQEKDLFMQELHKKAQQPVKDEKSENDLERYETELHEYRRQLEEDRAKLNREVEGLRERNRELDDAIREMEMEMSKERAELARERMRLERMRDELKGDMERMQRELAVRDSMAPVQKLRDELTAKQAQGNGKPDKGLNDRLKSFRNQLAE